MNDHDDDGARLAALLDMLQQAFPDSGDVFDRKVALLLAKAEEIYVDARLRTVVESRGQQSTWIRLLLESEKTFSYVRPGPSLYRSIRRASAASRQCFLVAKRGPLLRLLMRFVPKDYLSSLLLVGFFSAITPAGSLVALVEECIEASDPPKLG